MTHWMRKLHKWFGLLLALQFVVWMASGLVMSLLDHDEVRGDHHRASASRVAQPWPAGLLDPLDVLRRAGGGALSLETSWLQDRPVYRLSDGGSSWLIDAQRGGRVEIDAATAAAIAEADYKGSGTAGTPLPMLTDSLEFRGHARPMWRIDFHDDDATTLYVSGQDGRVVARRNTASRIFDIAWMLHIMDYEDREDFHHPLVLIAAVGGLWIALTGAWLLVAGLRMRKMRRACE